MESKETTMLIPKQKKPKKHISSQKIKNLISTFEPKDLQKKSLRDEENGQICHKSESFLMPLKPLLRLAQFFGHFPLSISSGCKKYNIRVCSFIFLLSFVRNFSVFGLDIVLPLFDHRTNTLNKLLKDTLDITLKNDLFGNGLINNTLSRSFLWAPAVYFILITVSLWKFSEFLTKLVEQVQDFDSDAGITKTTPSRLSVHLLAPSLALLSTATYIYSHLHLRLCSPSITYSFHTVLVLSISFLYATFCSIFYELVFYHTVNILNVRLQYLTDISGSKKIALSEKMLEILETLSSTFGSILLVNLAGLTIQWIVFWYLAVGTNLDDFTATTLLSGGCFIVSISLRVYSIGSAGQSVTTGVKQLSLSLLKYKASSCSQADQVMSS